jgi:hypothetical protein
MKDFNKIVRIGNGHTYNGRAYGIYCKITYKAGRLSITGVEGPMRNGNACGSCGQIHMSYKTDEEIAKISPAPGWSHEKIREFFKVWDMWHLNDMRAGCQHQRAAGWGDKVITNEKEHPQGVLGKACPVCGYKYGTSWLKEDVPEAVLEYLRGLPETDTQPAWV